MIMMLCCDVLQGTETQTERSTVDKQVLLLFAVGKKKMTSTETPSCAMTWVPYTLLVDLHDRCVLRVPSAAC